MTSLICQKTSFFDTRMIPGSKLKFCILTAHLQDMPNHILEYQLSSPENADVVQVTNYTEKKGNRFSTII